MPGTVAATASSRSFTWRFLSRGGGRAAAGAQGQGGGGEGVRVEGLEAKARITK